MSDERYAYYAFISYSHKDEKWAKWLQYRLERYSLPTAVRKESDGRIPKHVRPVFRDKTDIGIGLGVEQNLRRELVDSRFLIMVCSPASAGSDWVDKEVRHFQELGRGDWIIPFIVDGTPTLREPGEEQCFPQALLKNEEPILDASLSELKPEQVVVKVVAAILGLKFDQLWQRHQRQERAQRIQLAIAASLLVILAYLGIDYYFVTHVGHYADYIERWGGPAGIMTLSSEEVAHRCYSWRMVTRQGKPRRLVRVNSSGQPRANERVKERERPVDQRFHYAESGHLIQVDEFSPSGQCLGSRKYMDDQKKVSFHRKNEIGGIFLGIRTVNISMDSMQEGQKKGEVVGYRLEYDALDLVQQIQYMNHSGWPTTDVDGVSGQKITRTQTGQIETITYLDRQGQPLPVRGVAGKRYSYDPHGNRIKSEWIDHKGAPVLNPDHIAWETYEMDSWGNLSRDAYFDDTGNPALHELGVAGLSAEYDARGNMIRRDFFRTPRRGHP